MKLILIVVPVFVTIAGIVGVVTIISLMTQKKVSNYLIRDIIN